MSRALEGHADSIAQLRAEGPQGLSAVLQARRDADRLKEDPTWAALVDAVAGQRDATYSELFWHTSLGTARAAAGEKPILSLRLMGKLTDEYSCANSRFFRTALYAHPELATWLRENFILHWSSERPVPKVTVDYGDGRVLQRTVTGNSVHYVLDAQGRPIDAVPGLYSPDAFRQALEESLQLHASLRKSPARRDALVRRHHERRIQASVGAVHRSARPRGVTREELRRSMLGAQWVRPTAAVAAPRAPSKAVVERRLVEHIAGEKVVMTADGWTAVARTLRDDVHLHPRSLELIADERPDLISIGRLRATLEESIAEDTVRNEYGLRVRIHGWFARGEAPGTLEGLNARVYAELFLTPAGDPWLGLVEPDVYTGLERNGLPQAQAPAPQPQQAQ